jgi:large subunit ribosomal protein L3
MFGFAKKVGMTRLFVANKSVPVTVLEFDTNSVITKKTTEKDGYNAVQISAFKRRKSSNPVKGHLTKNEITTDPMVIGEFKIDLPAETKEITITDFQKDDVLKISGITKGRGFTGAVKRWGFHGQPASHGHDHERAVGSIGSRWPQRVLKGKKMAGNSGNSTNTVKGMVIVDIDPENKLLFVKGSVPGANHGILKIEKVNQ